VAYSFGDIEKALATVHHIAPNKRSAFANRLKHLQRLGFPPGINTGRGRAADYQAEHVVLLALALELLSFGYTPERAAAAILDSLAELARGVDALTNPETWSVTMVCNFAPRGLADLQDAPDQSTYPRGPLSCMTGAEAAKGVKFVTEAPGVGARIAMFSLSGLVNFSARILQKEETDDEIEAFFTRLASWSAEVIDGDT
jgi:hypothetical protein